MKVLNILIVLLVLSTIYSVDAKKKRRQTNTIVETTKGPISGNLETDYRSFFGVPFALPPVDELRWEIPLESESWNSTLECKEQKPQCAQNCTLGSGGCSLVGTSEDCLYVDVFTPLDANPDTSYPVLVFIPGGAFVVGTGACPLYDASYFAKSGIIIVNINYRLGVFGFLRTDTIEGNFGFRDQILALQWVRDNIQAFGGDPDQVTISGESAGAFSVAGHLSSPESEGLFHRAILQSDPLTVGFKDHETARGFSNKFISKVGCEPEDIICIRSKTMEEVLEAQEEVGLGFGDKVLDAFTIWTPVLQEGLVNQPLTEMKEGRTHNVPVIIGDVANEATLFTYLFRKSFLDLATYNLMMGLVFGVKNNPEVLKLYPGKLLKDNRPTLAEVLNDYLFHCPARYQVNQLLERPQDTTIYHYLFNHSPSQNASFAPCNGKVCHGSELSFEFNTYHKIGQNVTQEEIDMSNTFNNYWVNFITCGDPNVGLPTTTHWNPITLNQKESLIIKPQFESKDILSTNQKCDLFDSIGYRGHI